MRSGFAMGCHPDGGQEGAGLRSKTAMELTSCTRGGSLYGELRASSTKFLTALRSGSNDASVRLKFTVHAASNDESEHQYRTAQFKSPSYRYA